MNKMVYEVNKCPICLVETNKTTESYTNLDLIETNNVCTCCADKLRIILKIEIPKND